jgi:hypothetical protein
MDLLGRNLPRNLAIGALATNLFSVNPQAAEAPSTNDLSQANLPGLSGVKTNENVITLNSIASRNTALSSNTFISKPYLAIDKAKMEYVLGDPDRVTTSQNFGDLNGFAFTGSVIEIKSKDRAADGVVLRSVKMIEQFDRDGTELDPLRPKINLENTYRGLVINPNKEVACKEGLKGSVFSIELPVNSSIGGTSNSVQRLTGGDLDRISHWLTEMNVYREGLYFQNGEAPMLTIYHYGMHTAQEITHFTYVPGSKDGNDIGVRSYNFDSADIIPTSKYGWNTIPLTVEVSDVYHNVEAVQAKMPVLGKPTVSQDTVRIPFTETSIPVAAVVSSDLINWDRVECSGGSKMPVGSTNWVVLPNDGQIRVARLVYDGPSYYTPTSSGGPGKKDN